ncbi:MAG: hypothetical protein C4531_05730 [Desulfurivibrio sp.]|jgi:uncharacterized protein YqeY|nr:MAG: hypothetical protein C4531_05730 [Desulfurivibrio sp.]
MTLQEKIRSDLKQSMKAKTEARTSALRVLIGEFGRQLKKELADAEVLAIIRKLIKSEAETLEKKGEPSSEYMQILEGYLPKQASEAEIRAWIEKNIDFGKFQTKMQAMKPIMANFAGMADGNTVKKILESL